MNIFNQSIEGTIQKEIIPAALEGKYQRAAEEIGIVLDELYANIPDNKHDDTDLSG